MVRLWISSISGICRCEVLVRQLSNEVEACHSNVTYRRLGVWDSRRMHSQRPFGSVLEIPLELKSLWSYGHSCQ